jgi:hypothetical protein
MNTSCSGGWNEFSVHLMKHHITKHKRYLNADQKKTKQDENIKDVSIWKGASSKSLTSEYITNNVVICDGGEYMSTVKDNLYTNENIHMLQISNLDLWVTDRKNPSIGLRLILPGQSCPVLIRLPRSESLGIMSNDKIYVQLCVHVLKHSHNLYQGIGGTTFLQIMIINITSLVHNQEEQKEESNLVYTK